MCNEYRHVELLTDDVRRGRWTTEQKVTIIEQSFEPVDTVPSPACGKAGNNAGFEIVDVRRPGITSGGVQAPRPLHAKSNPPLRFVNIHDNRILRDTFPDRYITRFFPVYVGQ